MKTDIYPYCSNILRGVSLFSSEKPPFAPINEPKQHIELQLYFGTQAKTGRKSPGYRLVPL